MLIDSHCHLNYLDNVTDVLQRGRASGVSGFMCISVEQSRVDEVVAIAQQHADVWASVGVHPDAAAEDFSWVSDYADKPDVVAIGETGLDYYRTEETSVKVRQQESFAYHLDLARQRELPVIVHTRKAEQDTLKLMAQFPDVCGVLHCFTESWEMAEAALDMGFYISISGIVTFKNAASVRDVAARVPEDRLLVETDAPWLAPVPYRGKTNEPAFVADTARFIAELRDVSLPDLAATTSANFTRVFPLTATSS